MSDRIYQLLLVDDDPIFRLGLRTALEPFPDLQVGAEAATHAAALQIVQNAIDTPEAIDLVVLELHLSSASDPASGLQLCQQLKAQYPKLPILLLLGSSNPLPIAAAKQAGTEGYCPKGSELAVVVAAMRQLLAGNTYWTLEPRVASLAPTSTVPPNAQSLLTWRHRMRQSGLKEIDQNLAEVTLLLQNPNLSTLDWLFWRGRLRELRAARWLVSQLLPGDVVIVQPVPNSPQLPPPTAEIREDAGEIQPVVPNLPAQLSRKSPQAILFDSTLAQLQSGVQNLTDSTLEIDILREDKKRELLSLVLRQLESLLAELRSAQLEPIQLQQKLPAILRDLWQASIIDFFGKYYTLRVGDREYEVIAVLLQDAGIVQSAILNRIPLSFDLFSYFLFQTRVEIDNVSYGVSTPEALARCEILLNNLVIQVANAVMQPLLNNFADVETLKQNFYDRRLLSTRDIARFRNELSWRYRLEQYLLDPQAVFESRYNLLVFSGTGIKKVSIYAPRRNELEQLTGVELIVTLALEARDAVAPRLRRAVSFVGKGAIYVLTQVLGRGIGLVGRGIIQGIGSTLQETRFGKNGDKQNR